MREPSGRVPLLQEEPDYGWTRYEVLSETSEYQLIETETYHNSDALMTRYQVKRERFVEPISQINVTFGSRQMFVIFYIPVAILCALIASWVLRLLIQRILSF